jgi:dihydroorotase
MVQKIREHELVMLYQMYLQGLITLPQIAEKAAYNPAVLFKIKKRGLIAKGYYADIAIFDPKIDRRVREKNNVFYKCEWSPLEGQKFEGMNSMTFVNGELTYWFDGLDHKWIEEVRGMRMEFDRQ